MASRLGILNIAIPLEWLAWRSPMSWLETTSDRIQARRCQKAMARRGAPVFKRELSGKGKRLNFKFGFHSIASFTFWKKSFRGQWGRRVCFPGVDALPMSVQDRVWWHAKQALTVATIQPTYSCHQVTPIHREPFIYTGYRPSNKPWKYYLASLFQVRRFLAQESYTRERPI